MLSLLAVVATLHSAAPPGATAMPPAAPPAEAHVAQPPPQEAFASPAAGLYPLWEVTGGVLPAGRIFLGSSAAEVGLPAGLQLGLSPTNLVMRVPNLHLKGALYRGERVQLAAQVGAYLVLPGAHEAFLSSRYASGIQLEARSVLAVPLSLAVRWDARPWLRVHASTTALGVTGRAPVQTDLTPGAFASVELAPQARHGLFLHGAQLGLGRDGMQVLGASYRFHNDWFEGRLGYVYRRTRDGIQGQPLLSLGLQL